jgi:small-conductance mechanosensitive channel
MKKKSAHKLLKVRKIYEKYKKNQSNTPIQNLQKKGKYATLIAILSFSYEIIAREWHIMNKYSSRGTYFFSIFAWGILLACTIVIYTNIIKVTWWSSRSIAFIDTTYIIIKNVCIIAFISSITSLIFREIRHSGIIENIIIRRFLPIIRFFVTSSVWAFGLIHIFEELSIDTKSILTGAGIGGAILALAGKDIMTNLFWSMSILLGRVFDIGETVRIKWGKWIYEGVVEEITLNYTRMTNKTGELIYIPNRTIYTEVVENLSRKRFETYTYLIPINKANTSKQDAEQELRIIEWKIAEYDPLLIEWEMENPNASDFMYRIIVRFPEKNDTIDREIRMYLTEHIFRGK